MDKTDTKKTTIKKKIALGMVSILLLLLVYGTAITASNDISVSALFKKKGLIGLISAGFKSSDELRQWKTDYGW